MPPVLKIANEHLNQQETVVGSPVYAKKDNEESASTQRFDLDPFLFTFYKHFHFML